MMTRKWSSARMMIMEIEESSNGTLMTGAWNAIHACLRMRQKAAAISGIFIATNNRMYCVTIAVI